MNITVLIGIVSITMSMYYVIIQCSIRKLAIIGTRRPLLLIEKKRVHQTKKDNKKKIHVLHVCRRE